MSKHQNDFKETKKYFLYQNFKTFMAKNNFKTKQNEKKTSKKFSFNLKLSSVWSIINQCKTKQKER